MLVTFISFSPCRVPESDKDDGSKRGRYNDNDENSPPCAAWDVRQMSAFRPWSPGMLKDAKFREG